MGCRLKLQPLEYVPARSVPSMVSFGRKEMTKTSLFSSISIATIGVLCMLQANPVAGQEKLCVTPHAPLLKSVLPDTENTEVAVYETEYAPGGINPRSEEHTTELQ